MRPDPGITQTEIHRYRTVQSESTLIYPNKSSLIKGATQRTRVRARNQVTKKSEK